MSGVVLWQVTTLTEKKNCFPQYIWGKETTSTTATQSPYWNASWDGCKANAFCLGCVTFDHLLRKNGESWESGKNKIYCPIRAIQLVLVLFCCRTHSFWRVIGSILRRGTVKKVSKTSFFDRTFHYSKRPLSYFESKNCQGRLQNEWWSVFERTFKYSETFLPHSLI